MREESFIPGKILAGRYQVRRELGRGGMGVVYLCRDLVADERVAVKLLGRPVARSGIEEMWWFREEARALAGLSHPAIVRARDFGALADGTPYLAMDAVPGRSLHEWFYLSAEQGGLPWPTIWTVIDEVLGALAHAHARSVIHGDLKPSNILLDMPSDGGTPKVHVLDLGLAWLIQDRVDHRLDGTRAAEPTVRWGAGTPGWMAPEQIRFAAPHVGAATDLYALGCILYTALSNEEPYTGTDDELLQQHRSAPIPEPRLPPDAPAETAAFVKRLMAKRPWHRYDFAGDARRAWRRLRPAPTGHPEATPVAQSAATGGSSHSRDDVPISQAFEARAEAATTTGLLGLGPNPFVARVKERERLFAIAVETSEVEPPAHRFVLLSGEAGVGKSRLAEWLCEEVHERALMIPLRARYRKIGAPLDGIVGAVTQHYRLERADREVVEKVLMNLWGIHENDDEGTTWVAATAEWLRPLPPGTDAVGPSGKRFALQNDELRWLVIRRTLEQIGKNKPILLWLDDMHFATPSTLEALKRVRQDAKQLRLLIVATMRSEAVQTDAAATALMERAVRELHGERIELSPLDLFETHMLLRETLPLDDAAVIEAAQRSKGNPLFALQLVHAWAHGGHLTLRDGRYSVPESSLAVQAATTTELWEERLRLLSEDLRAAALAAAALGGDIRRDVLSVELAGLGFDAERAIGAMQRAQILLASGADRLRWPHALLQEHLLATLLAQPNASQVLRAAADALSRHPAGSSRRIVRHRVVNLIRAGDIRAAATLLHGTIAQNWGRSRDASMTLRDLELLDGRLEGTALATHLRWRAEALRHAGRLEESRREAEEARRIFHAEGDRENEAHCLRLLGHLASDLAAPAQGRRLVARALTLFEDLGDRHGRALCEVTLGEIDFLLGDHARARSILAGASQRFLAVGDRLGLAQCLVLQGFVEQAGGSPSAARKLVREARGEFEAIGYRLGLAQCDITLAHSDHREGKLDSARATALVARRNFRDLANPRGEAACERLLAMAALDAGQTDMAEAHARSAAAIFDRLNDAWGQVEVRLLFAQIALDRGDTETAREELIACEAVALAEAEPKQHRHLTLAWLAYHEGRFQDAARELDNARVAFKESCRTGDHTPQLLERFVRMGWPKPASARVSSWRKALRLDA
jgi:serine/threonine protein kinase